MAYALQQEYIRRSQIEEASQQTQQRHHQPQPYNPGTNQYPGQGYRAEEYKNNMGMSGPTQVLPGEKKKKKGFGSKIKSIIVS